MVVIVGCLSEVDADVSAVNFVLWRSDIEKLNKGKLFADIIWRDAGTSCEAEKTEELGDPNNGTGAGRAEPRDANVGIVRKFGRARGR